MTLFHWSKTAASNGTADVTCPFPEGMGAPALNDGARGMMAAVAKYRDDMAGAIVTTGTLNSYSVFSYQGFDSLADMNGQEIAFSPHVTNGDTVVLNVDLLGAKPLRSAPGVELLAGTLILGTPYMATYNNTDGAWYLKGYYASPYNVPFLGGMDYWDTIAPNSAFIFPAGQAISRTVYSRAFARWGTTYGVGDGSTTFNVPDKTGRVSAMLEPTASRLTTAVSGINGNILGAAGGTQNPIQQSDLPNVAVPVTVTNDTHSHDTILPGGNGSVSNTNTGIFLFANSFLQNSTTVGGAQPKSTGFAGNVKINGNVAQTNNKLPPLIVCNYILRIL